MAVEKTKIIKLDDDQLEKVSGGFIGPNEYSRSEYHDAGFITDFAFSHPDMCALYAGSGFTWGHMVACKYIDEFVAYYQTHTLDEYVNYIRTSYFGGVPEYVYYRGYDVS